MIFIFVTMSKSSRMPCVDPGFIYPKCFLMRLSFCFDALFTDVFSLFQCPTTEEQHVIWFSYSVITASRCAACRSKEENARNRRRNRTLEGGGEEAEEEEEVKER